MRAIESTSRKKMLKVLLCSTLAFIFTSALFAQTATVRGVITDESGAIVPGGG